MKASGLCLLVVDDEGAHRDQLRRTLQHHDCSVSVAARRDDAVTLLRTGHLDLVIVEPNLPEVSWIRMLRSVRLAAPSVPLLVVTAFFSCSLAAEAVDLGAIAVLAKPVNGRQVLDILHGETPPRSSAGGSDLSLAHVEWEHINSVLRMCDGNMAKAARSLGITRQSLYNKLRKAPPVCKHF
jgi:ActR/RegA family two-component response regulator